MNYIYIGNRQVGKSTMAMHKFMEDPEHSIMFVQNMAVAGHWKEMINKTYDVENKNHRIVHIGSDAIKSHNLKRIIFDEFFFFDERKVINIWAVIAGMLSQGSEVYIYSTLNPTHKKRQELFIQQLKNNGWKVMRLKGGKEEYEPEIYSWVFETPEYKIPKDAERPSLEHPRILDFKSRGMKTLFHDHYDRKH